MTKKLLVIVKDSPFGPFGDHAYHLLDSDTGEVLRTHICSGDGFAFGDLWANREELQKQCKQRFGEIEVKYLKDTDIDEKELLERNHQFVKGQEKE